MAASNDSKATSSISFDVKSQLRAALAKVQARNPQISLRAFAKRTGVNATSLSLFLNGKRDLSHATCRKLFKHLEMEAPADVTNFLVELGRSRHIYLPANDADTIAVWSHWLPIAILSLFELADTNPRPAAVARRFGVTTAAAKQAIEVLTRLNLLVVTPSGLKPTGKSIMGGSVDPSPYIRESQLQVLKRSAELQKKLRAGGQVNLPFNYSFSVVATDPAKINRAKEEIGRFRRRLVKILGSGNPSEVYLVAVDLLPLTAEQS